MRSSSLVAALCGVAKVVAQDSGADAGKFSAWVVALEWQPGWNQEEPHQDVVAHTVPGVFAASHLSLHGLWPQYSTTSGGYPQFCKGPLGDFTVCEKDSPDVCEPSADTLKTYNTSDYWQKYALEYAYSDLAVHEWSKHGGCSGWDQDKFFSVVDKTVTRLLTTDGAQLLTANVGGNVTMYQIQSAFAKKVEVVCNQCFLKGIRLVLAGDPTTNEPGELADAIAGGRDTCSACPVIQILAAGQGPQPVPTPSGQCIPNQKGPACTYDAATTGTSKDACTKLTACVRCAHSGHCTAETPTSVLV